MLNWFGTYRNENALIDACKKGKASAQQQLYEKYAGKMLGVCLRYFKNQLIAEDVLVRALTKMFHHLNDYAGKGSFEGWVRKIVVRECLNELRTEKQNIFTDVEEADTNFSNFSADADLANEELLQLIQSLPIGYRAVFNLYVIEGYSHQEIAEQLGISEGTSKSQLNRAKQTLQKMIEKDNSSTLATKTNL